MARFRYTGPDGVLEYQWRPPQSANDGLFGTLTLNAQMTGDTPVTVPLANSAALSWSQTATPDRQRLESRPTRVTRSGAHSAVGSTTATVRITGQLVGKTLALAVTCDQPKVTALDIGAWGPVVRRRQVAVPYYPGAVHYLPQEGLFVNALLDWTASAASSHSGTKANYNALTDGTRVPLSERVLFTAAWHLAEVLPNPPNPPSPWRDFLANKVVLDIWGGSFTNIAANLADARRLRHHQLRRAHSQLAAERLRQRLAHALPGQRQLRRRCRHEQPGRHRHAPGHSLRAARELRGLLPELRFLQHQRYRARFSRPSCSSPGTTPAPASNPLP